MNAKDLKRVRRELNKPSSTEHYQFVEGQNLGKVQRTIMRLSRGGWRLHSYGLTNGLNVGWYAVMTRTVIADYSLLDRLCRQ